MAPPNPARNPNGVDHEAIDRAHQQATRDAFLEHARMGRPVSAGRNGQLVWLTPEEVFAMYGLDENGKTRHRDDLPSRAAAALTAREATRAEPLRRLRRLADEAHAAGLDAPEVCWSAVVTESLAAATARDLQALRSLNLGAAGEPGEPIRWNDPRLGPLWPDGEPAWYIKSQQLCRDLEAKLAYLPSPNAEPLPPELAARLDNFNRVKRMWAVGKLAPYKGEYVVADGETVFAHGKNLVKVWERAEKKLNKVGRDIDLFTEFYVM